MPKPTTPSQTSAIRQLASAQHGVIMASQLAELLDVMPRTVQKRAQAMPGVVLAGRVYLLTADEAARIAGDLVAEGKRGPKTVAQTR